MQIDLILTLHLSHGRVVGILPEFHGIGSSQLFFYYKRLFQQLKTTQHRIYKGAMYADQ